MHIWLTVRFEDGVATATLHGMDVYDGAATVASHVDLPADRPELTALADACQAALTAYGAVIERRLGRDRARMLAATDRAEDAFPPLEEQ